MSCDRWLQGRAFDRGGWKPDRNVNGTARGRFTALQRYEATNGTFEPGVVTELLRAWGRGDHQAREELLALVYEDLQRRAAAYLRRERADHTLEPAALVHEAYLRLVGQNRVAWQNRAHFFGVAAQMMRRILVDHARGKRRGNAPVPR